MSRTRSAVFCIVIALFAFCSRASAQQRPLTTTWSIRVAADSRCADDAGFLQALAQQIPEEQRAAEATAELVALVRVSGKGPNASATVTVIDRMLDAPAGARELALSTDNCAEIAEALSLIVGVLVEAGRGIAVPAVEPAPSEPAPVLTPPAAADANRRTQPPATAKDKRYRWLGPRSGHDLAVGVGPAFGLLPGLAWGGTFGWGIRVHDVWPFWLSATAQLPKESSDGRAEFSVMYGSVHTCPLTHAWSRWRVRGCAGFSLGVLGAEGRGFLAQKRARELLALAGIELATDVRVWGPWTFGVGTRVDVPLIRPRFVYYRKDGETPEIHEARSLTIQAFLTTGVRFH